jgi:hypothetical protein
MMKVIGIDSEGFKVADDDGFRYRLTPCCGASTTGTDEGVVCRSCYEPTDWRVDDSPTEIVEAIETAAA